MGSRSGRSPAGIFLLHAARGHDPEADDPFYERLPISEQTWQAGVGRIIEASLDTYHFAFTHQGTIGDPAHPEAPKTEVVIDDDCFYIEYESVGRGLYGHAGSYKQGDQIVVESMQPWELTTDLDAELQVYVDRPTVAYRR